MQQTLTPVLNVETSQIVFLPLANPIVNEEAKIFEVGEVDGFKLLGIYGFGYSKVRKAMGGLMKPSTDDTKNFVVKTLHDLQSSEGKVLSVPAISYIYDNYEHLGYGQPDTNGKPTAPILFIYEQFTTIGGGLVELINDLPKIMPQFFEATLDELVEEFGIDASGMDDEAKYDATMNIFEQEENIIYESSYDYDGKDLILYSKKALSVAINADSNMVVTLPTSTIEHIKESRKIRVVKIGSVEFPVINDDDYLDSQSASNGIGEPSDKDTKDFILKTTNEQQASFGKSLSLTALAFMYDKFIDDGYNITGLVTQTPASVTYSFEGTPNELIKLFGLDVAGMDEEAKYEAIINAIECEAFTTYETSYTIGGSDLFLYRTTEL